MTSAPLRLTAEDKLDVLRKLDTAGEWQSLDDRRYCTRCEHLISGRQIEVAGGTRAHGPLRLECPTEGCAATPADWTSPHVRDAEHESDVSMSHHIDPVRIKADAEGISITHNGRAAIVRRTRSGHVVPLSEIADMRQLPQARGRFMAWLARNVAAVAIDGSRLLGALRPFPRAQTPSVH
jgi:hypothetical protein